MIGQLLVGLLTATAALTATPVLATAQPEPDLSGVERWIDDHMAAAMAEEEIPGAAVTAIAGGEQILNKGYGLADVEKGIPVDPDRSRFLVGSQAKLFTAQAALQLVHEGELDLDTDVNEYLRTFQIADTFPGQPITLRHLLTYTAGFDEDHMVGWLTHQEPLAEGLAKYQPARVRPPGSGVVYDNYGIALAGYLVEIASGMPYADYVEQHVFRPLGMNDSDARCGGQGDTVAYLGDGTPTEANCGYLIPSGTGPASTPADMGRYMLAQLNHDPRLGPGIAAEMQRQQHTEHPALRGVGYIFEHIQHNGHPLLFKGGEMPGMNSYMLFVPELDLGINVVSNGDGRSGEGIDGIKLVEELVDEFLPELAPPPRTRIRADVEQYTGWYQAGRTSRFSMYKVKALWRAPAHVTANGDGSIRTTGLSGGPKDWDQVGPGVFAERGGWRMIAFPEPGQLAVDGSTNVFDRISIGGHPQLHLAMFGFGTATGLLAVAGFPLLAAIRRARRRPAHPRGARIARVIGWITGAAAVVFAVGFGSLMLDEPAATTAVVEGTPTLIALLLLASATVPLAVLMVFGTLGAWSRRWWRLTGRIAYTALTLGALSFAAAALLYNFVGPPFH
ncbi:beta-lactamase family protein [Saccharopolyspora hirsuta]|uniref:Beta-lactamase family protein n=1 Tax=Saccharopolyspora hirsuta TaxID=1837 RepID=A0A5M7BSV5_SACHI|nr:serine hydrolase domain-containing protein [Saccharopolyspora hirsuta]KAA5831267.1 beta-lactamase family protein [Saccharopolyspora hirsuta]